MTKTIKVDGAFPSPQAEQVAELLASGWHILDKTVVSDRYIIYLLEKKENIKPVKTNNQNEV